jgi:hypothetical protein
VFPHVFWDKNVDHFGHVSNAFENTGPSAATSTNTYSPSSYAAARGGFYMFLNAYQQTGLPVLVSFVAGESAYSLEKKSDFTVVSEVMTVLRGIFCRPSATGVASQLKSIPDPAKVVVTRWGSDEFATGSYSYVGIGSGGQDYDSLAKPIGHTFTAKNPCLGPSSNDLLEGSDADPTIAVFKPKVRFAGEATCRNYPATVHGAFISGLREAASISNSLEWERTLLSEVVGDDGCTVPKVECYWNGCTGLVHQHSLMNHIAVQHLTDQDRLVSLPLVQFPFCAILNNNPNRAGISFGAVTTIKCS